MALGPIERRTIISNTNSNHNMNRPSVSQQSNGTERQGSKSLVTRSQSIKIPQHNENDYYSQPNDESMMKTWEQDITQLEEYHKAATMQMYHRIMDYRARTMFYNLIDDTATSTPNTKHDERELPIFPNLPNNANKQRNNDYHNEDLATEHDTYMSEEDGAIFDLDL